MPLLNRTLTQPPPLATKAVGCWIEDDTGQRYLDASGGAAVSALGHAHPKVREALVAQIDRLDYVHSSFFTSAPAEALGDELLALGGGAFECAYFVNDGSEAVEAALKLARQAAVERGEPDRRHVLARDQSYHGNTLGALALSGMPARRAGFDPFLTEVERVSPCYAYRHQRDGETAAAYGQRLVAELEMTIALLGGETILAVVLEPVSGASLGAALPVEGYLRGVRALCDAHGITLIFDEVMCGAGRTGPYFAFQAEGAAPDICTLAKGLGGGAMPLGAVLVSAPLVDQLRQGSGVFRNGHTYSAHPLACAAGLAVTQVIRDEQLCQDVAVRGKSFGAALCDALGSRAYVGDIRGRGFFWGIELVADQQTKAPFDPGARIAPRIKAAAMARGLCVYPGTGTADGTRGDHILLAPPYVATADDLDQIVQRTAVALSDVLDDYAIDDKETS